MHLRRIFVVVSLIAVAVFFSNCENSTPAHFEIINTAEGVDDNGMPYVEVTIKNTSNGSGKGVTCAVTVKEYDTSKVLGENTIYFAEGGIIEPEETATGRAIMPGLLAFQEDLAQQVEESEAPILDFTYDLSWEDVDL